jgi:hypothetical protein
MGVKLVNSEVIKDGQVIKPAEYSMDVVQTIKITTPMVDQRIAQLTAELSKWQEIKDQITKGDTPK